MIEARSPSVSFREQQAGERERGLCRGFVTLPEGGKAGLQENILWTVIQRWMESCHGIILQNLYETMVFFCGFIFLCKKRGRECIWKEEPFVLA